MTLDELKKWVEDHDEDLVNTEEENDDGNIYSTFIYEVDNKLFAVYKCNDKLLPKWIDRKGYSKDEYEIVEVEEHLEMVEVVKYIPVKG